MPWPCLCRDHICAAAESVTVVKANVTRIFQKSGCINRVALAMKVRGAGLL